MIYADQDEQRGCVKVISQTALSFMPVLISEIICGCLCLCLGLSMIYARFQISHSYNNLRSDDHVIKTQQTTEPLKQYSYHLKNRSVHNTISDIKAGDDQANKLLNNHNIPHQSYPPIPFSNIDKSLHRNTINL